MKYSKRLVRAAKKFVYYMMDLTPPGEEVQLLCLDGEVLGTATVFNFRQREDGVIFLDLKNVSTKYSLRAGQKGQLPTIIMNGRQYTKFNIHKIIGGKKNNKGCSYTEIRGFFHLNQI